MNAPSLQLLQPNCSHKLNLIITCNKKLLLSEGKIPTGVVLQTSEYRGARHKMSLRPPARERSACLWARPDYNEIAPKQDQNTNERKQSQRNVNNQRRLTLIPRFSAVESEWVKRFRGFAVSLRQREFVRAGWKLTAVDPDEDARKTLITIIWLYNVESVQQVDS